MPSLAQLHHQHQNGIPCPRDFNFATHVVDKWALHQPSLLALHWVSADMKRERKLTYAELAELSERAAVGLAKLGIRKGERVMVSPCLAGWPSWLPEQSADSGIHLRRSNCRGFANGGLPCLR